MDMYVLDDDNRTPVRCDDIKVWGRWFGENREKKIVKQDDVLGSRVSTVFLGLNHEWVFNLPPLLFETMIFGGEHDLYCERCTTWDQAVIQHKRAVEMLFNVNAN